MWAWWPGSCLGARRRRPTLAAAAADLTPANHSPVILSLSLLLLRLFSFPQFLFFSFFPSSFALCSWRDFVSNPRLYHHQTDSCTKFYCFSLFVGSHCKKNKEGEGTLNQYGYTLSTLCVQKKKQCFFIPRSTSFLCILFSFSFCLLFLISKRRPLVVALVYYATTMYSGRKWCQILHSSFFLL